MYLSIYVYIPIYICIYTIMCTYIHITSCPSQADAEPPAFLRIKAFKRI